MRILLTNDDGINSPGIRALNEALRNDHEVWVFAPDGDRSGMSHYITLKDPVRAKKYKEQMYSCSGSPVDCVLVGSIGLLPEKPDVVISGINMGPNVGTDIVYSGTAAAARQAAFMGIPGIAVSISSYELPYHFDPLAAFVSENLDLLKELWHHDHFININGPNLDRYDLEIKITFPSRRVYHDSITDFTSPNGEKFFFLTGSPVETKVEEGSDWAAVSRNAISISPVFLHPVNHMEHEEYLRAPFSMKRG
jgi:5'-nucleotidase